MPSFFKKICALGLQVFVSSLYLSQEVQAQEIQNVQTENIQQDTMGNIPRVSELSNVEVSSRNFEVIEYFIKRYNIDIGYSLDFFHRQGQISRTNFTFILNKVIQYIDKLQSNQKNNFVTNEELKVLRRLQSDFYSELNLLKNDIKTLERNIHPSFSSTTILRGESIFTLIGVAKGNKANDDEKTDSNIAFGSRAKLDFNTSFTGQDRLKISLKASNIKPLNSVAGTDMARLAFQGDDNHKVEMGDLTYRFPIGKKTRVYIGAKGLSIKDFSNSVNPYLDDSGDGAVSRFGQRNPLFRQGGGAGMGVKYKINNNLEFGIGYAANDAEKPDTGLNKSDYAAIAQFTLEPNKKLSVGLNYIRSYNSIDTNTGSNAANNPFNDESEAITANSFGVQASYSLNENVFLGSWVGYTRAKANDLADKPSASIVNWAVTLALPNLGKQGNLAGIVIGQPPKLVQNDYKQDNEEYIDKNTSLHFEAFYRININDNIGITPGIVLITNPNHDKNNDTIMIGTLRTTFSF